MRNKKTILSLVALVMVVSICVVAFAGCQNKNASLTEVLYHFDESSAEVSVHTVELTGLNGYTISSVYDDVVIASKQVYEEPSYTKYVLYNAVKKSTIATTEGLAIRKVSYLPIFYYTNSDLGSTYFYSADGLIVEVPTSVTYTSSTYGCALSDGRIITVIDGDVKVVNLTIDPTYDMYASNIVKSGNKYYSYASEVLTVFNSDKTYDYTANLSSLINGYDCNHVTLSNGYVLLQTLLPLSENEALRSFDFYQNNTYYNINTYVYDLNAKSYTQIDYNAFVYGSRLSNNVDYTALSISEINADSRLSDRKLVVVDHNLNKVIDLDAYMPNVVDFKLLGNDNILLTDGVTVNYYNNDNIIKTSYLAEGFGSDIINIGRTFYKADGSYIWQLNDGMALIKYDQANQVVYYSVGTVDNIVYYAKDLKNEHEVMLGSIAPMFTYNNVVLFTNNDGLKTVYSAYDLSVIGDMAAYTSVSVKESNGYSYITARDENYDTHIFLTYVG